MVLPDAAFLLTGALYSNLYAPRFDLLAFWRVLLFDPALATLATLAQNSLFQSTRYNQWGFISQEVLVTGMRITACTRFFSP
jgi:hypothetical protein